MGTSNMTKDAITTSQLSKRFSGKRGSSVLALDQLDLTIGQGEVFGFLGPNGAGKSTTIKILMGLIRPSQGQATLHGVDAAQPEARRTVGYLPENPSFYDYLSGAEYLAFVGGMYGLGRAEIAARAEELLHRFSLWEARKRPLRSYSKGMVQRLGLAQVMLHDPQLYILDEPMSGLDPLGRALVKEMIRELRAAGKSVFFSTHITSDVEAVCDRVGVILRGRLQSVEHVDAIMTSGITGYQVRHRVPGSERAVDSSITKEKLQRFMADLEHRGEEVLLVNPLRRSLEDFFLEVVRRKESEQP